MEGYDRCDARARAVRDACRTILHDGDGSCGLHLDRLAIRRELDDAAGLIGRALAADAPEFGAIRAEQERRHLEFERQLHAAQAERDRAEAEWVVRRINRELEMQRRGHPRNAVLRIYCPQGIDFGAKPIHIKGELPGADGLVSRPVVEFDS